MKLEVDLDGDLTDEEMDKAIKLFLVYQNVDLFYQVPDEWGQIEYRQLLISEVEITDDIPNSLL